MWISYIGLVLLAGLILYQDLKDRLINLWAILGFGVCSIVWYLNLHSVYQLLENVFYCCLYLLFCYLALTVYFFLRSGGFQKLLDVKIGWGDVLIFVILGATIEFPDMIYFFTSCYIIGIVTTFFIRSKELTIPLAGISVVLYGLYTFFILVIPN